MRILIFSQYYTPEPPLRPCELASALQRRGHEVLVVTGMPSYPMGKVYPGYDNRWWRWDAIDGVTLLRLPVFPDHSQNQLRRALYYSSVAAGACVAGPLVARGCDVAFVYSPPPTLGAAAILTKALRGVPFVYDVQDLWPESLRATTVQASDFACTQIGRLVRRVCRSAAALTVISEGFREHFAKHGVPRDKIHVIPNWANDDYGSVTAPRELARELGFTGFTNIVYAGNVGLAQSLDNLLDAAALLRDLARVRLVIVGDGVERTRLEERAAHEGLANVVFLDRRSPAETAALFQAADALLIHLKKDPLFAITVPSKTIAYLASGKPIIGCTEGDTADILRRAGVGPVCEPGNPGALAASIRAFVAATPAMREEMGRGARNAYRRDFAKERLVVRFESLFESIAAHHPPRSGVAQGSTRRL